MSTSVHFYQAGMSAEDMFNILKNGADSGAYTIDKVADALKSLILSQKRVQKTLMQFLKS